MDTLKTHFKKRLEQAKSVLCMHDEDGIFRLADISPSLASSRLRAIRRVSYTRHNKSNNSNNNNRDASLSGFSPRHFTSSMDDWGFAFPDRLLEKPRLFLPSWTLSEYGELHGRHEVNTYPRFYFFGDTLTDWGFREVETGFGSLFRMVYDAKVEVVNRGFSGYNSKWLRQPFQEFVIDVAENRGPPAPLLIVIWLGYEDARLAPLAVHVPLLEFEQNLRHYVQTILDHPGMHHTKIVLITPPPINVNPPKGPPAPFPQLIEIQRNMVLKTRAHRTWLSKRDYAEKVIEIGEEYEDETMRVAVVDLWQGLTQLACGDGASDDFDDLDEIDCLPGCGLPGAKMIGEEILIDGLRLGKKAHEMLASELLHLIRGRWPEISPEELPCQVEPYNP